MLPFSDASERNKEPIARVLMEALADSARVVEIGAGTGQHAVHFACRLPHLTWQPTDRAECLPGLLARVAAEGPPNLMAPLELDVARSDWAQFCADAFYTANTLHIMSWPEVESLVQGIGRTLTKDGLLIVYGPFRYGGRFTSESNARFDQALRERDPLSGIRDIESVDALAGAQSMVLEADHRMPANNRLLIWRQHA
jgi:SAM-dependent methyltransferase